MDSESHSHPHNRRVRRRRRRQRFAFFQKAAPGDRMKEIRIAPVSVLMIPVNAFQLLAFYHYNMRMSLMLGIAVASLGFLLGSRAVNRIQRYGGVLQGEGAAFVGKWGNLALLLLTGGAGFLVGFRWVYKVLF